MIESSTRLLIDDLNQRFPILRDISGQFGDGAATENIPWFFGLLMSAASNRTPGSYCFVLDKTLGTTALTAVFVALVRIQRDFPDLAQRYAQSAFVAGQLVKVKPSDYVYEYEGLWDGHADKFRLKVQDKLERRTFPVAEILRLEPTTRKRPKGTLSSKLGVPERVGLDDLLGVSSFGNNSMIQNNVLLHMARTRFEGVAETVSIGLIGSDRLHRLFDIFPWGTVGPDGEIRPVDQFQVVGEPVIAVSRVLQDIASAGKQASIGTKAVLIDGARSVVGDLQALDDLAERQRVVILASPDEVREIGILNDRGIPVWHLDPSEIMLGEARPEQRSRQSLVGRTVRTADIWANGNVITVNCNHYNIQKAAEILERVAGRINQAEENLEAERLVAGLYKALIEISESCLGVDPQLRSGLDEIRDDLHGNQMWIDRADVEAMENILSLLANAADNDAEPSEKGERLREILSEVNGRWAILTRSSASADSIREALGELDDSIQVLPSQAVGRSDEWDGVILLSWPGQQRFNRLSNRAVTRDTRVLVYPFEASWLSNHQIRESRLRSANQMDSESRGTILGIDPDLLPKLTSASPPRQTKSRDQDQPILDFERRLSGRRVSQHLPAGDTGETRPARLIEFYGGCHIFASELSQVHVLNSLVDGGSQTGKQIQPVSTAQLSVDDFVMFRAGGGGEFVRLLATTEMGVDEYVRLRAIAEGWKQTVRTLGRTPNEVRANLAKHGLERTLPTIRDWLSDPDLIAPASESDLNIIAEAASDPQLLDSLGTVKDAISRIRGAHVIAGNKLTKLILSEIRGHLTELDGQPIRVSFSFGQAWIVQVAAVNTDWQECPADQVNRLIWTEDLGFW